MGTSLSAPKDRLSDRALETLDVVRERGDPYWWLSARRCQVCGQGWLVGQEERQNDVYCLRRLDNSQLAAIVERNEWPGDFDSYEVLLEMGLRAGHRVRFADPLEAKSLAASMEDLAKARPNIRVSELARLLNLEPAIAYTVAMRVSRETGAPIDFDVRSKGLDG
jgi:hypothetical protein